jgi:hypothetical protein
MSSTGVEPKGPHGPDDVLETSVFPIPSPDNIDEKKSLDMPKDALDSKVHDVSGHSQSDDSDEDSRDAIIITGADASRHLLPMRDDHDSALTFRSILLSSGLACFQAVMYQIYTVGPHSTWNNPIPTNAINYSSNLP